MFLRRAVLSLTAACCLVLLPLGARAQSAEQAAKFVQAVGQKLVGIVNGPGSDEQKSAALARVVDADVDVQGVGRFVLGRFWRVATPKQRQEYQALFHKVLVAGITSKIGEYEGVRFTVGRATSRPEGQVVASTIAGPKKPAAEVDWVVQDVNGSPKIVDVIAEGTSLRLTQRDDYASYIVQHQGSVQALLDAMRRQAQANG